MFKFSSKKTKRKRKVKREIFKWVRRNSFLVSNHKRWYVGITNNSARRKREHEAKNKAECKYWKAWDLESIQMSLDLETELHRIGMLDKDYKGGYTNRSTFIYVYKKKPTIID
ncbi:GIY-YIG nuclease family protein [Aureivirga sp. CE67]|uniref:GIY-YIG nuclease family protein n=1 Tax=Aureivirga sp. CE67 TaxID=1788983 RepID=UPI0018CAB4FC|nr:GIY-YIG nuclease family protein [Aureivirga sp. CE67]